MITLIPILFAAGVLTILLPCILPLIPIVLGTSVVGRSRWRPLLMVVGMLVSFVLFTFVLIVLLGRFPQAANAIRIATYDILFLFGAAFVSHSRVVRIIAALFFWPSVIGIVIASILGIAAMELGGKVAGWLQTVGSQVQQTTQSNIGADNPLGALIMGSTLGLVWVPCAGPALSFVFALLTERPGIESIVLLTSYGLGTALPLLAIGYGGQYAVHSVRAVSHISGRIKQMAGVLLILSALGLQLHWFRSLETWLVQNTAYGTFGTELEEQWLGEAVETRRKSN